MDKKMEKLLKLLQDDAKLTVQELAVMLDMTEAEVAAAIHKFEKDGVIKATARSSTGSVRMCTAQVHSLSCALRRRRTPALMSLLHA